MEINKWNILLITTKTCFRVMVLLNGKSFKDYHQACRLLQFA